MTYKNKKRSLIAALAVFIVGAALATFIFKSLNTSEDSPAPSTGSNAVQETSELWMKRCAQDNPESCEIFRRLTMQKNNMRLLEVALSIPKGDEPIRTAIVLPLGITVSSGIGIRVDDGEQYTAAIKTCNTDGCYALINLPEGFIDTMQRGALLNIVFLDAAEKPIKVEMTLKGFAEKWKESTSP